MLTANDGCCLDGQLKLLLSPKLLLKNRLVDGVECNDERTAELLATTFVDRAFGKTRCTRRCIRAMDESLQEDMVCNSLGNALEFQLGVV